MLAFVLETMLTLAHPFAPFVTETIWQTLKWEDSVLATSTWPTVATLDKKKAQEFEQLRALITEIRFVAAQMGKGKLNLLVKDDSLVKANEELVVRLANLKGIEHVEQGRGLRLAIAAHEAWLDVDAATLEGHQAKLQERLAETRENIARLETRLQNKGYIDHAPAAVVQQTHDQLAEQQVIEARLVRELGVVEG
jgi:valyl-tRNA synthetase